MGEEREKCSKEKITVKVVWKNVRKIRTRENQMELEDWMKKSDCDVCSINETGYLFLKGWKQAGRYEWLLGSIYMNCECVRGDENVFKMLRVKDVVRNAKRSCI